MFYGLSNRILLPARETLSSQKILSPPICTLHSAISVSLLHPLTPSSLHRLTLHPLIRRTPPLDRLRNPVSHHCRVSRRKSLCFPAFFVPNRNTHFSRST